MPASNTQRLRKIVEDIASGQRTLLDEFRYFHHSVEQKLWSVDYFLGQISNLELEHRYEQRMKAKQYIFVQVPDWVGFGLRANMLLDGFLMNAMAALDTFAHEVTVLYHFTSIDRDIYIKTVKTFLARDHPNSAIYEHLKYELDKPGYDIFANYRHCTTHESILASDVRQVISLVSPDDQSALLPLPDDPRRRPSTYSRNREMKSYCQSTKDRIARILRCGYKCVIQDIANANNVIPIT